MKRIVKPAALAPSKIAILLSVERSPQGWYLVVTDDVADTIEQLEFALELIDARVERVGLDGLMNVPKTSEAEQGDRALPRVAVTVLEQAELLHEDALATLDLKRAALRERFPVLFLLASAVVASRVESHAPNAFSFFQCVRLEESAGGLSAA